MELLESNHQEQQHYVLTATIERDVRQTRAHAYALLDKFAARGNDLERSEMRAHEVSASSEILVRAIEVKNQTFLMRMWLEVSSWWIWPAIFCCKSGGGSPEKAKKWRPF